MIKKLRIKFVALSMGSLLLVLLLIMASVNLVNYRGIIREADDLLAFLAENGGGFPQMRGEPQPKAMSPELPYESRFFSVMLDSEGGLVSVDTGKIAAVDSAAAIEYARSIWASGQAQGVMGRYRYLRVAEEGGSRLIFLDCGRNLDNCRRFLLASAGISAAGYAAVLCLVVLFSGRIIKPVSESYEKQKQFITDAGHEIKTPLTIIAADAEVLEMELGENEWLRDIQAQAKRLADLTKDLIYLSRMEEAQADRQMIDFPVSDIVEETARSFLAPAIKDGKQLDISIRPGLSMNGDENGIRQLVSILLDNALKYSPPGGRVQLSLEKQQRNLCLRVSNLTEAELPWDDLGRLFERFYRADPSRSAKEGGYGIGLSVARAIVSAHRGKISANAPEKGRLCITAQFPI